MRICSGQFGLALAYCLVQASIGFASSSYVYTNAYDLYEWVTLVDPDMTLYYDPHVYWFPETAYLDSTHESTIYVGDNHTMGYYLLYILEGNIPGNLEWPTMANSPYEFCVSFDDGPHHDFNYMEQPGWGFWGTTYGRFNLLLSDSTAVDWIGSNMPQFATNGISGGTYDRNGFGWKLYYSLYRGSPYWDKKSEITRILYSLPRWDFVPLCACTRANYQGGDDWVWATASAVYQYWNNIVQTAPPLMLENLPQRLSQVAVWFVGQSTGSVAFRQNVIMTNVWGVYTNTNFKGVPW